MDLRKLNRLKGQLNGLRRKGSIKSSKVEALAEALGRVHDKKSSKEPTWINRDFRELRPLRIPHHSNDLNKYTAGSILDQLEGDIEKIEEVLKRANKGGEPE